MSHAIMSHDSPLAPTIVWQIEDWVDRLARSAGTDNERYELARTKLVDLVGKIPPHGLAPLPIGADVIHLKLGEGYDWSGVKRTHYTWATERHYDSKTVLEAGTAVESPPSWATHILWLP